MDKDTHDCIIYRFRGIRGVTDPVTIVRYYSKQVRRGWKQILIRHRVFCEWPITATHYCLPTTVIYNYKYMTLIFLPL